MFKREIFLKSLMSSVDMSKSEVIVNYTLPVPPVDTEAVLLLTLT